jgi:hypothetical protein
MALDVVDAQFLQRHDDRLTFDPFGDDFLAGSRGHFGATFHCGMVDGVFEDVFHEVAVDL